MKTLSAGLSASLNSGVTTLAWCWLLERRDAATFGFTDHDKDLSFGGVTYQAATGLTASAFAASTGLAVDTIDAHGALQAASITEDDLARGLWDGAEIEVWRVDWSEPANRVMMFAGTIGEVERGELAFRAELRSLAHALNQAAGRIYSTRCDADVGDTRCGVNLASGSFTKAGSVLSVIETRSAFRTSDLGAYAAQWFSGGLLTWTTGANAGAKMEVKRHTQSSGNAVIEFVQEMAFDIADADQFTIVAGCDKTAATCESKFNNVVNFRGFPHMPGNDWVASYPNRSDGNDGGRLG